MTDTYNDTTGSRKKFLIPLVVLLLCAVSLTGAGYAYNASVTMNDNTAPVDEYLTIDLKDGAGNYVYQKVTLTNAIDGLGFETTKTVDKTGMVLSGVFDISGDKAIIRESDDAGKMYTGKFVVNAQALDTPEPAITKATVTGTATAAFGLVESPAYLSDVSDIVGAALVATVTFYSDAACETEVTGANFTIGTDYYYQIAITSAAGTVTAEDYDAGDDKTFKADKFAKAVVDDVLVVFGITLNATTE